MLRIAVAVAAALVALAFSMSTFERWLDRGRRHELAWSASLAMFAVASAALAAGAGGGWNGVTFRTFFLFGAILNVPFLALGTVYLHAGTRTGDRVAIAISLLGAFAVGVIVIAPFTQALPRNELAQGSKVFGVLPRVLAGVSSGVGALVVFGGAVWSAVRVRRARVVMANVLIAGGTAIVGASGLLNSVVDAMTAFAVTLLVGITVLFAGFLIATTGAGAATGVRPSADSVNPGRPSPLPRATGQAGPGNGDPGNGDSGNGDPGGDRARGNGHLTDIGAPR
jgi:hypothetical protein